MRTLPHVKHHVRVLVSPACCLARFHAFASGHREQTAECNLWPTAKIQPRVQRRSKGVLDLNSKPALSSIVTENPSLLRLLFPLR